MKYYLLLLLTALSFGCGGATAPEESAPPTSNIADYHGGPVVTNPLNIHLIWYGNWTNNNDTSNTVNYFLNHISSTPYYDIDRSYYEINDQGQQVNVTSSVKVVENLYVGSPRGIALTGSDIASVVSDALTQYGEQPDPNGFYMVITDVGIQVQSFCYGDCGWHNYTQINGVTIVFSHIGNPQQCASSCLSQEFYTDQNNNVQSYASPNNNWTADGIVNVMTHELSETLTDPQLNAWVRSGAEVGDLCEWQFGNVSWTDAGAPYNVVVGDKNFLVQQLWYEEANKPDGGVCALQP